VSFRRGALATCRRQLISPRVEHHLRHDTAIDTAPTSVPNSSSTFESEFGRFMHGNKLDRKSMSLEVLGGYGVTLREGSHLQAWNSIRRGAYYSCFGK
jgi:hypothetical protein